MSVAAASSVRQPAIASSSTPRFDKVVSGAAFGGILGAAAGAGLSFTALPFIGGLAAPFAAAIGGAAGLVIGGLIGFLRGRSSSDDARVGAGTIGHAPPAPGTTSNGLPPALPAA